MKLKLLLVLLVSTHLTAKGNDGAFYAKGGNVFPMKETTIELRKEILNIELKDDFVLVNVLFNFYNPSEPKILTVGFVTPPPDGDVPDSSIPGIEDFTVKVSGARLAFQLKQLKEPNEELGYFGNEFLYLFEVNFRQGITTVEHTYRIQLSTLLGVIFNFDYILQTGLTWANDQIDDFTLNIKFDQQTHFSLPSQLIESPSKWKFKGTGRLADQSCLMNSNAIRRGFTKGGTITFQETNFKPKSDIKLVTWKNWMLYYMYSYGDKSCEFDEKLTSLVNKQLTKEDTRLMRNFLFAIHGYQFKSAELSNYFEQQYWYFPNPAVKNDLSILTKYERELFDYIQTIQ